MNVDTMYTVNFDYDADASVWVATSPDVQGLVLEGGSLDALQERVRYAVPELLDMNGQTKRASMVFVSHRQVDISANA